MKYILFIICLAVYLNASSQTALPELSSPNGSLRVKVSVDDSVRYSLFYKNEPILLPSAIALITDKEKPGVHPTLLDTHTSTYSGIIKPPYGNFNTLVNSYSELTLTFSGNYSIIFRAYNEGMAYRFKTVFDGNRKILSEAARFRFSGDPAVIFPETDKLTTWEVTYKKYPVLSEIDDNRMGIVPALFSQDNIRILVAESDLHDYPGMYLKKKGNLMEGFWAGYPKKTEMGSWGNFVSVVKARADYIADTKGVRSYPWRVIICTDNDKDLLTNQLIYKLATPSAITNTSWIKPGKAAWEWWHDAILEDADIPSGMDNRNTALYKHYIDFAAENHLEYLMVDAGWSNIFDLTKVNSKVDIQEIIQYGKSKHVGVFLWCVASTLIKDLDKYMDQFHTWGNVGLKVDFFDRDDQLAIQWYEDIAKAAASRNLMVDFHGSSKPTGLERTYPNIINYEAVRGAECSKWDYTANPDQHLLMPFIRLTAGPMDYTPGSMRNKSKKDFVPIEHGLPSTQGTRCHELAMYILFYEPLAMLCDSPSEYRKYPDIMKYLSVVPTSFDTTLVLDAKLGEYAVEAKRKGNDWFVGAMTNFSPRKISIDFSFLPANKKYYATIISDSMSAELYTCREIRVNNKKKIDLQLAEGGGAVLYLHQ